jgi:internalin A
MKLQMLECNGNRIRSLEPLRECTQLQTLDCSGTGITTLDPLRNCVNLQTLDCSGTGITSLDPLRCLQLQTLDYHSTIADIIP